MIELEKSLQERSTADLQTAITYRHLTEEASTLAREILKARGVTPPDALPEEMLEEGFNKSRENSNKNFLITVAMLLLWGGYGFISGQFEHGQQDRLNQSIRIRGLLIASVWGWSAVGRKK